ncbi:MAG: DEAD/DEAH box helicase [Patescibacteria group bacterium]
MPKSINPSLYVQEAQEVENMEEFIPQHNFSDFAISDELKKNILAKGYNNPTPIQDEAIEPILLGKDVIGLANTGTGKTAAFLIPLINKVLLDRSQKVLIIVPTRELAVQIQDECRAFTRNMNVYSVLCIGGASLYKQAHALRAEHDIVIGTPGRIKDLDKQRHLKLQFYNNIVLDEVDRMMDMGFITDIKFLISRLPQLRQSLFFSATLPDDTRSLAHSFLRNPVTISVKSHETPQAVEQDVVRLNGRSKADVLIGLLSQKGFDKVLVFGRTKWGMNKLADFLDRKGFRVAAIHGNKNQNQRLRALEQFKNGHVHILIATDVASRGLDIDDVTHVINFDEPASYDDYIHRIGRTGRANKRGIALTFIN